MGKARRTRQTREQERRARTRRTLIATGAAVVLVAAAIVIQQVFTGGGSGKPDPSKLVGVAEVQSEFDGLTEKNGTIGPASAKVTIVEYGDLACPICKQFDNDIVPRLVEDFVRTGKARLRLRVWPIVGPSSVPAAQAAYAAAQQNALWRFAALTYLNQGDEAQAWFTPALARSIAAGVDLDIARFDRDRASAAANTVIEQVTGVATAGSFPGTPTIQIVGPSGTTTVDATYDAIAAGVQKASGTAG
jgi:protein-disulfide isomerase